MSSSNLFLRPNTNGTVPTLPMSAINRGLDRRTSVMSMSLTESYRTSVILKQQPSKDEQEALAAPDMLLKHGRISGLTWWCTFKDSQLERLYRKFFYLDAHFHFQFLGLANIMWDVVQIITFFINKKYTLITNPITTEQFNNFTCRSTICYEENIHPNNSVCDIQFREGHDHPLTPHPRDFVFYEYGALPRLIIHSISLIIFVTLAIVWQFDRHPPTKRRRAYALLLWLILCVINYSFFSINPYRVPDDEVGFTQFIIFMTYTLIPVPLFWSLSLATILSIFHMILIIIVYESFKPHVEKEIYIEIFAIFFILLAANLNGFYHNTLYELSARRTFLTIRDSAKASILINNQYQKIKYLLLSIMPKYFYLKYDMSDKNFGITDATEQNSNFKVLHVDHMESVSILFADVCGFTKLSSSIDAKELVELLNRLFGEFDELAKVSY
ncbi:Adenylate cyclase type 2-like isoform X4 [Oopsacas minuta]|uniref:adenylate cyclase n=1 Tax=Oopsacas minuta TaxID=111878 RepID=A0AAV7KMD3_9METZ|nr:Adenylate cyclase type 2-like isoform X4 [Oopsacas minuta]